MNPHLWVLLSAFMLLNFICLFGLGRINQSINQHVLWCNLEVVRFWWQWTWPWPVTYDLEAKMTAARSLITFVTVTTYTAQLPFVHGVCSSHRKIK